MKTVRLGKTGLLVSRVGIGGIPIQRPPLDEAVRVIHRALDLGITFIDTAVGYGDSEARIGQALAMRPGLRERVAIATKGGGRDRATALEQIDLSLKRLNTDYIDLWQFHGVSTFEAYEQILGPGGAMEGAREALETGKIRHIGLSSHSLDVALRAVASGHFETIQFPLNFVADEAAVELVPLARAHDVGFIAMKPLAGGNLRDANLAIKYLLQFDGVVPDPGIEKAEEIEEIVGIVDGPWDLTQQDRQRMTAIRTELGSRFCRQCGYCMPCPQEVDIRMAMIMHVMWKLWPRESFIEWMGEVVDTARECAECGECETKCPYHLPIREMLVEHVAFYERVKRGA